MKRIATIRMNVGDFRALGINAGKPDGETRHYLQGVWFGPDPRHDRKGKWAACASNSHWLMAMDINPVSVNYPKDPDDVRALPHEVVEGLYGELPEKGVIVPGELVPRSGRPDDPVLIHIHEPTEESVKAAAENEWATLIHPVSVQTRNTPVKALMDAIDGQFPAWVRVLPDGPNLQPQGSKLLLKVMLMETIGKTAKLLAGCGQSVCVEFAQPGGGGGAYRIRFVGATTFSTSPCRWIGRSRATDILTYSGRGAPRPGEGAMTERLTKEQKAAYIKKVSEMLAMRGAVACDVDMKDRREVEFLSTVVVEEVMTMLKWKGEYEDLARRTRKAGETFSWVCCIALSNIIRRYAEMKLLQAEAKKGEDK